MRKTIFSSLLAAVFWCLVAPAPARAVPDGSFVNPITDVAWQEVLPIRIGGFTVLDADVYSAPDPSKAAWCTCPIPFPPFFRIGITISFNEPARTGEAVKDAWYYPSFGFALGEGLFGTEAMGAASRNSAEGSEETFYNAHWFIFPVWGILELLVDMACMESSSIDLAFMTEILPTWHDDSLAVLLSPEMLLFANPIAQMACAADAVSTNIWRPLDFMFWCQGAKSAYPLTGHMSDQNNIQVGFDVTSRMIYNMSRLGMLWDYGVNYCTGVPTPIWVKSHHKLQRLRPTVQKKAFPIGTSAWKYQQRGNLPSGKGSADNFSFLDFRKRWCCFL